jgi:lipoate-protein ligase A
MNVLDLTLATLAENLALDEALLLEAEAGSGGEVLRFWEWPSPAVVLGAGCRLAADVNEAACQNDAVPIARRTSGGGTVLLNSGCLLFSLVLAYDRSPMLAGVVSSYVYILDRIRDKLRSVAADIEHVGTSDLAIGGNKLSGNAQQRKRSSLLHHGSLLYRFDIGLVGRYLHMPERQPDYRQRRDHAAFMTNLPFGPAQLKAILRETWQADNKQATWPGERVKNLTAEKYGKTEWIYRR